MFLTWACMLTEHNPGNASQHQFRMVAKWEAGQAAPSTANLVALAHLLNVPLEELTEGKPEEARDIPEAAVCPRNQKEPEAVPEASGAVPAAPGGG